MYNNINNQNIRVILASASPRRQELLRLIFDSFEVIPSDVDETLPPDMAVELAPEYFAKQKCRSVYENNRNALVIGSDTGVFIDGKMLGKPQSTKQAFDMLTMLSGRTHKVITGCCVKYADREISFSSVTRVKFKKLTNEETESYINSKEPLDKAGAYGIQGKGALFVEEICGDYYSVMGLPVNRLYCAVLEILNKT